MSTADIIQDLVDDAEELDTDIGNAYDEVQSKGGTVPQNKNTNNLAPAIRTIPTGITPTGQISITQNGTYDVTDYASASVAVPSDNSAQIALNNISIPINAFKNVTISPLIEELRIENSRVTNLGGFLDTAAVTKSIIFNVPNCTSFNSMFGYKYITNKIIIEDCKVATFNNFSVGISSLVDFSVPPNKVSTAYNFPFYGLNLTNASLISAANGLVPGTQVFKTNSANITRLSQILGDVDGDGLFVENESGTVTLADFITQTKGWSIST